MWRSVSVGFPLDGEGRKTRKRPEAPVRTASPQMCDVVFSLRGRKNENKGRPAQNYQM